MRWHELERFASATSNKDQMKIEQKTYRYLAKSSSGERRHRHGFYLADTVEYPSECLQSVISPPTTANIQLGALRARRP